MKKQGTTEDVRMYMTGIHATTHYFGHGAGGRAAEQKAEDDFMERMSQEFREWYEEETGWDIEEAPNHDVTEILWLAWQASRAAVEVEIPEVEKWRSPEAVRAQRAMLVLVKQAISGAGIKVKGE